MQNLLNLTTEGAIHQYGYPIFLILAIVEGPVVTVIASFFASVGLLNIFVVYILALAGDLIGDSIYYYIGKEGKKKLGTREKIFGVPVAKITELENHFNNHGGKTLIISKMTHGVGFVALLAAGAAEMPFWRFFSFSFLGSVPKVLFFTLIGFYSGKAYSAITQYIHYWSLAIFGLAIVLLCYFFRHKLNKDVLHPILIWLKK